MQSAFRLITMIDYELVIEKRDWSLTFNETVTD